MSGRAVVPIHLGISTAGQPAVKLFPSMGGNTLRLPHLKFLFVCLFTPFKGIDRHES